MLNTPVPPVDSIGYWLVIGFVILIIVKSWLDFGSDHKTLKCELCGDPATTWNCFCDGDGPIRVCKGCDDSINKFYGEKCDLICIRKKEKT